jgi:hypothetical protein
MLALVEGLVAGSRQGVMLVVIMLYYCSSVVFANGISQHLRDSVTVAEK